MSSLQRTNVMLVVNCCTFLLAVIVTLEYFMWKNAELSNIRASYVTAFINRVPLSTTKNNNGSGILAHVIIGCQEDMCQKLKIYVLELISGRS
jgi:hypothetical protein